jgi:ribonuclease Z
MFDSERTQIRDAGRGATIRLYQLKLPIWRIDVQFLTHYHSDHTSGIPDLWLTGWLESHFGTHKAPYRVIGPTGAHDAIAAFQRHFRQEKADGMRSLLAQRFA